MPTRPPQIPKPRRTQAWNHAVRLALPLVDFAHDAPNDCAWPGCKRPATHVQTWSVGQPLNATTRSRLLCPLHAQKSQPLTNHRAGDTSDAKVDQ